MALKQIHLEVDINLAKKFKVKTTLENVTMKQKISELMQSYVDEDKKKN